MYERSAEGGTFGAESKSNENEADLCVKYVESLVRGFLSLFVPSCPFPPSFSHLSHHIVSHLIDSRSPQQITTHYVPPHCITLVSPYNSQVALLSSLLHPTYPEIEIGSIDGQQGRENEVVIISLVRSNDKVRPHSSSHFSPSPSLLSFPPGVTHHPPSSLLL
jgi:DNA polymerase alpha-associated DNA helicase A